MGRLFSEVLSIDSAGKTGGRYETVGPAVEPHWLPPVLG